MFGTLKMLMDVHGPNSKGIVWAHNSHASLKSYFGCQNKKMVEKTSFPIQNGGIFGPGLIFGLTKHIA